LKEFGVVNNMFKQKIKKEQKQINDVQKKKQTKKLWSVLSCRREWDVHREEKCEK